MNTSRFAKSRIFRGDTADRILIKCGCGHLKDMVLRQVRWAEQNKSTLNQGE